jgi:hypothetical protein
MEDIFRMDLINWFGMVRYSNDVLRDSMEWYEMVGYGMRLH